MPTFDTCIQGIECQCRVVSYQPAIPARVSGPPEDCYPAEASEFEFQLLDKTGSIRYDRLEASLTDDDLHQLQDEYEAFVTAHKHGIDY